MDNTGCFMACRRVERQRLRGLFLYGGNEHPPVGYVKAGILTFIQEQITNPDVKHLHTYD